MYDLNEQNITLLDKIKSAEEYDDSPMRCNLHPKLTYSGNYLSIDTLKNGYRSVNLYKLDF